ncbi:MAG: nitroreductase family protein [Methanobacteriaceae archaeon]|nr:nitroreductase family protein [Methanobacteriaceae archaeon]
MKLFIDEKKCIACKLCVEVCIHDNIRVINKAEEIHGNCFECGHCMAICPVDAITLNRYTNQKSKIQKYGSKELPVSYDDMLQFLKQRRSCRWFKDKKIDKYTFNKLFEAAYYSPSRQNLQDVEIIVLDKDIDKFISFIYDIIKVTSNKFSRVKQLGEYLKNKTKFKHHPLLWEGQQLILIFSEDYSDALIAATRIELLAYTMGLGGFYSLFIMEADKIDHDKLMMFFPEIDNKKHMYSVFVIGYPRILFNKTIPHNKINVFYK